MAVFGKFHAAYYWLLGRRNLVGIEIAARSEGTQSSAWRVGVILTVNKINRLGAEKVVSGAPFTRAWRGSRAAAL